MYDQKEDHPDNASLIRSWQSGVPVRVFRGRRVSPPARSVCWLCLCRCSGLVSERCMLGGCLIPFMGFRVLEVRGFHEWRGIPRVAFLQVFFKFSWWCMQTPELTYFYEGGYVVKEYKYIVRARMKCNLDLCRM